MKEIANKMIICNIHRFLLFLSIEVFRSGSIAAEEIKVFNEKGYQLDNYKTLVVNDEGQGDWVTEVVSEGQVVGGIIASHPIIIF